MFSEILSQEWAIRALAASMMVGLMCGVLGCFIVLRNMSLIGDALSHAILPGVVFAFMLVGYSTLGFFIGSVLAGLLAAIAITWIQQNIKTKNDAAIGIVFTAMFSVGVMGISWISRSEGVHLDLKDFLFGNVLGVSDEDLWLTLVVTLFVIGSVFLFYRYLFITTFQSVIAEMMGISVKAVHYFLMLLLSFSVVASLQTVGVILVVAMLITPAATALLLSDRLVKVIFIAGIIGMFSAALGLFLAIVFETTPGPAIAVTATLFYCLAALFSPKKGLVFSLLHKRQLRKRIHLEDILKQALKLREQQALNSKSLYKLLNFNKLNFNKYINTLKQQGYFENDNNLTLTEKGVTSATQLVRAHRLWETYQVEFMGLTEGQIHDEAEHYEHFLTDELLNEVDKTLGFPTQDPHGSPIPPKRE